MGKWIKQFGINRETVHGPEGEAEQAKIRKPQGRFYALRKAQISSTTISLSRMGKMAQSCCMPSYSRK
jgi:hypothetical protein